MWMLDAAKVIKKRSHMYLKCKFIQAVYTAKEIISIIFIVEIYYDCTLFYVVN